MGGGDFRRNGESNAARWAEARQAIMRSMRAARHAAAVSLPVAVVMCPSGRAAAQGSYVTLFVQGTIEQDTLGTNPQLVGKSYLFSTSFNAGELSASCPGSPTPNIVCAQTSSDSSAALTTLIIQGAPNFVGYRSDYVSSISLAEQPGLYAAINAGSTSINPPGGNFIFTFSTPTPLFSVPVSFGQNIAYTPAIGDTAYMQLGGLWNGTAGAYQFTGTVTSVALTTNPSPHIVFFDVTSGQDIDVTGVAQQPVVAGQQIQLGVLGADPAQSKPWKVPGNPVGGYTIGGTIPSRPCAGSTCSPASVSAADFGNPVATTFYWYAPSPHPYQVTYSGTAGQAKVGFEASGPRATTGNVTTTPPFPDENYVVINGQTIRFENSSVLDPNGITIDEKIAKDSGYFFWVQLVENSYGISINGVPRTPHTETTYSLDSAFPYHNKTLGIFSKCYGSEVSDAPGTTLRSAWTEYHQSFLAKMYLMWNVGASNGVPQSNSIPISLGYVPWHFSAAVVQSGGVVSPEFGSQAGSGGADSVFVPIASIGPPPAGSGLSAWDGFPQWQTVDQGAPPVPPCP